MVNGNVIVGQSGGPTAVINSSLVGVFKTAGSWGAKKIYGMCHGIHGLLEGKYVDLSEHIKNDLDVELLKRTPSAFLGSCRFKLPNVEENEQIYMDIFSLLDKLDIKHFFYIGGNDSMDTVKKLSGYAKDKNSDITFTGIPKTIDNDLAVTDHTPGFGSAAKYIASVMKEIIRDSLVYNAESITVVEIMGRNAGWLTAASALAKSEDCDGPDLIYMPENHFNLDEFTERVKEMKAHKRSVVVAVSEGLKTADGKYVCEANKSSVFEDSFGHKVLGGTALYLADHLSAMIGGKTRGIIFSTLQRCASHIVSGTDITEAFMAGSHAVQAAFEGETGTTIIFERVSNDPYNINIKSYDVNKIANIEKKIPPEWITQNNTYVSKELVEYVRPLMIGELSPFMVDGLPRHLFLFK